MYEECESRMMRSTVSFISMVWEREQVIAKGYQIRRSKIMTFNCPPGLPSWPPQASNTYDLPGPQVEPTASYWTDDRLDCPVTPCVVTIGDIFNAKCDLSPYPTGTSILEAEIEELRELASLRDDPDAIVSAVPGRERRAISSFLQLRPQPLGAVFNRERAQRVNGLSDSRYGDQCGELAVNAGADGLNRFNLLDGDNPVDAPVIRTGRELARYFEAETPGIAHRQALNFIFRNVNWSPPRQALVWMSLDLAIYSALAAAWYFKWRGPMGVSRRPRPIEYDYRVSVLYNRAVDCDGDADGEVRTSPEPSPGTPRHPAYPSGHSTYSAAASEICSYFFPDFAPDFDNLANNIGTARLWAGVHWRSDHEAGAALGKCVARLLIAQLQRGCITAPPNPCLPVDPCEEPPTIDDLDRCASECCRDKGKAKGKRRESRHAEGTESEAHTRSMPSSATKAQAKGPQQGAPVVTSSEDEANQARGPQQGAPPSGRSDREQRERARGPQQGA